MVETVLGLTDLQMKAVTGFGQLALATTVAYIAFQQWRTARHKLKLDMFDRRFAAHEELRRLATSFRGKRQMQDADAILALEPTFRYLFGRPSGILVRHMAGVAMRVAVQASAVEVPIGLLGQDSDPVSLERWKEAQEKITAMMTEFHTLHTQAIAATADHLTLKH